MGRHVPMRRTAAPFAGWLAVCFAAFAMACSSFQGPAPLQTWPDVKKSPQVVALDKASWELVAIKSIARDVNAAGNLHIRVELANLSNKDLPVQLQTLFRDENGVPVGEDTPFEIRVMPGGASVLYEVTAMGTTARRFTVQVKTP
jgi:hypothetical protein